MSFNKFINMVRIQASLMNNARTQTSVGKVTGYDPVNYLVTVELYPQDTDGTPALQTGWIPLFTPWIGDGWGLFAPPNIGDIIEVHYQDGSLQNGYAGLRSYNFGARPLAVPSGEFWLVHASGSFFKLTNDGKLSLSSNLDLNIDAVTAITLTAPEITLDSDAVALGSGAQSALLTAAAAAVYNTHTHNDPVSGVTGVPNQLMSGDETTNTTAS